MSEEMNFEQRMEAAITRALERRPDTVVSPEFSARVLAGLPAARAPRREFQAGRTVAVIAAVVLTVAMFALAPHSAPSFASVAFDVELMLVAQLGAIAWFLSPVRKL